MWVRKLTDNGNCQTLSMEKDSCAQNCCRFVFSFTISYTHTIASLITVRPYIDLSLLWQLAFSIQIHFSSSSMLKCKFDGTRTHTCKIVNKPVGMHTLITLTTESICLCDGARALVCVCSCHPYIGLSAKRTVIGTKHSHSHPFSLHKKKISILHSVNQSRQNIHSNWNHAFQCWDFLFVPLISFSIHFNYFICFILFCCLSSVFSFLYFVWVYMCPEMRRFESIQHNQRYRRHSVQFRLSGACTSILEVTQFNFLSRWAKCQCKKRNRKKNWI